MSQTLFFYGTLCHIPLLEIVLGRAHSEIDMCSAHLPDHATFWVEGEPFPMIAPHAGSSAQGILVKNLSAEDVERLKFYEGGFEYDLTAMRVESDAGPVESDVFFPEAGLWRAGDAWDLDAWLGDWGDLSRNAAREVMGHFGVTPAKEIAHLLPFFRARGWARQLAKVSAPAQLRRSTRSDEVSLKMRDDGYAGFFRLDTFDISHPRFDGTQSETLERGSFIAYDAALLLPYDPKRDLVMLIEELRFGPLMRGDPLPWVLEPIAGLVDAGEAPIEAARREAVEEAGLAISDIRPMMNAYPSPGYSTEFFHCFLGLCPLDTAQAGVHGLASENEDIRSHVLPFDQAMALLDSGEINQVPLAMMLLWLARHRGELRSQNDRSGARG